MRCDHSLKLEKDSQLRFKLFDNKLMLTFSTRRNVSCWANFFIYNFTHFKKVTSEEKERHKKMFCVCSRHNKSWDDDLYPNYSEIESKSIRKKRTNWKCCGFIKFIHHFHIAAWNRNENCIWQSESSWVVVWSISLSSAAVKKWKALVSLHLFICFESRLYWSMLNE